MKRLPHWAEVARELNQANGQHWFDDDTMRFFETRFHGVPDRHDIFVTSERNFDGSAREFRVRRLVNGGERVETLTEMDRVHATLAEARSFAGLMRSQFDKTAGWTKASGSGCVS